jgi:outer membrane protein OmpA-like peptidoglycan-associated protein
VIFFDTNRSSIRKADMPVVAEIARQLKKHNANVVRYAPDADQQVKLAHIIGWADTRASSDYNMKLSQRRAESVRAALVNAGVSANDLSVEARGETSLPRPTRDGVNEIRNRTDHIIVYINPVPPIPFSPAAKE